MITTTGTATPIPAFAPVDRPPEDDDDEDDDDDSPDPLLPDGFVLVGAGVIVGVVVSVFVSVEVGFAELVEVINAVAGFDM
jgi:hypothetical protein